MEWDHVQANWRFYASGVRDRWAELTDDDIQSVDGELEPLTDKLLMRYGYQRDRAQAELLAFAKEKIEDFR